MRQIANYIIDDEPIARGGMGEYSVHATPRAT